MSTGANHRMLGVPPVDADSHPSPLTIWDAIEGNLRPHQSYAVVDHISECDSCLQDWRAAYIMGARPPGWRRTLARMAEGVVFWTAQSAPSGLSKCLGSLCHASRARGARQAECRRQLAAAHVGLSSASGLQGPKEKP